MTFTFSAKKTNVSDRLKSYTEKKLGKLDRYFRSDSEAMVVFNTERDRKTIEVTIYQGALIFRARETTTEDLYSAVDAAAESIVRQIHKHKTRLEKRLREGAFERSVEEESFPGDEVSEEPDFNIVRSKKFEVKPVSVEEAILQMNMLGHQFYVFKDQNNDGAFAVVYRRNDGDYGLIETE